MWVLGQPSDLSGCGSSSYVSFGGLSFFADNGCVGGAALRLADATGSRAEAPNQLAGLNDSIWHQVAYTYDAAAKVVALYVDGVAVSTTAGVTLTGTAAPLRVTFGGAFDELAVFGAALSPGRLAAHFTAGQTTTTACAATPATPYEKSVLADSPSRLYALDELNGSRVAMDASGGCFNGSRASAAVTTTGAFVSGDFALRADPGGNGLKASSAGLPSATESRTVELWVKGDLVGTTCGSASYLKLNGLSFFVDNGCVGGGALRLADANGTQAAVPDQLATLTDDAWHQVAYSYDAGTHTVQFFVDGVAAGTTTGVTFTSSAAPLETTYAGTVDDVSVFPAVLSPARMAAHYTAGLNAGPACATAPATGYANAVTSDGPVRYYSLDEASGSRVALDLSGGCLNGSRASASTSVQGAMTDDLALQGTPGGDGLTASAAGLPTAAQSQTVELWVKGTLAGTICGSASYLKVNGLALYADNGCVGGAALRLGDSNGSRAEAPNQLAGLTDGKWHQVAYTFDAADNTVVFYVDGAAVGTSTGVTLSGTPAPLRTTYNGGIDDVSIYPKALSAARINDHYGRALAGVSGALVDGAVVYSGHGAAGSRVQACRDSVNCTTTVTDGAGAYHLTLAPGSYGVTAYPPQSGEASGGSPTTVPLVVGDDQAHQTLDITLPVPQLPPGASLTSPSMGTQTGVPVVFWGEPSTLTLTGCANGRGLVYLQAPDTATGRVSRRFFPLHEVPAGSGKYVATIPPLAPMHGTAHVVPYIDCAKRPSFTPTGGDSTGGTPVVVAVPDDTTVSGFSFGGRSATFHRNQPHVYVVTSPPGTGDVPFVVTFTDGTSRTLGTFHYSHVTAVSPGSKAGDVVSVTGTGFTPDTQVFVGPNLAKVTYVSPTRVDVTLPPSTGNGRVMVESGGGGALGPQITYESVDGFIEYLQTGVTLSNMWGYTVDLAYGDGLSAEAGSDIFMTALEAFIEGGIGGGVDGGLLVGEIALAPETLPLLVMAVVAGILITDLLHEALKSFDEKIDPSGTVVDSRGTPVGGATVTLLSKNATGDFEAVPDGSDRISPTDNPETTGAGGAFHWDAVAGTYQVAATSDQCRTTAGQPASASTESFVIPPPKMGIVLALPCTGPAAPRPVVTAVNPVAVPEPGGTAIAVTGTDLSGTTAVTVGGKTATFAVLSPYALSVTAPAGTSTAHVVVTTASGTSTASDADVVRYLGAASTASASTVTAAASKNPAPYGAATTVTATVTREAGDPAPTGTVTVSENNVELSTAGLDAGGKSVLSLPVLSVGAHTLLVAYSGDGLTQPSQTTVAITVGKATPVVTVTADKVPSYGDPVTLTAVVDGVGGGTAVTGQITFTEGGKTLGRVALGGTGRAGLTVPALTVGTHTITATYDGDTTYASAAAPISLAVAPARTTTVLTAGPSPVRERAPVTLQARVTSPAGTPVGSVTFADDGVLLGRKAVSGNGTASLVVPGLNAGTHHLTAGFVARSPYASSSGTAVLEVSGRQLSLSATNTHPKSGQSVTLTGRATGSWPSGTHLKISAFHGHEHTLIPCGSTTACTAKVAHSRGTWTYVLVAVDRGGRPTQASKPVEVTWYVPVRR